MSSFFRDLCRQHPGVFVDHDTIEFLPHGWRELAFDLVQDLVFVLGPEPSYRVVILGIRQSEGAMSVVHLMRPVPEKPEPTAIVVSVMISAAQRRSVVACERCGAAAVLRSRLDGGRSSRCALHAEGMPPTLGGRGDMVAMPLAIGDAVASPMVSGGITRWACRAFPHVIFDATGEDEVPPGWQGLACDLIRDVAGLMAGAGGQRIALRRLHAEGQDLRWNVTVPPDVPQLVRRAIMVTFKRANMEARWICRHCGSRDGRSAIGSDLCDCRTRNASQRGNGRRVRRPPLTDGLTLPSTKPGTSRDARRPKTAQTVGADGFRIPIYTRTDVAASLGLAVVGDEGPDLMVSGEPGDTEQQNRLARLLRQGDEGRWRGLVAPSVDAVAAVAALARLAPHMGAVIDHVVRHLRAALAIGLPIGLPPMLLLGPPGIGKTWLMTRLAASLGLPHRVYPMNLATLSDGLGGAHGSWRNASAGLVAKTLLLEEVANPLILVDEFDKVSHRNGYDPYAAFYTLIEPVGARRFVDEYLGVPFDASRILWVASANRLGPIPEPILDRLTVIDVPMPARAHLAAIVDSVYADANAARLNFFAPRLAPALRDGLAGQAPRSIRVIIEDAMVRAAAHGRRRLRQTDLRLRNEVRAEPIGFIRPVER